MVVKQQKYSVKIQTILSLVPFVNLWAAYRIESLRLFLIPVVTYIVLDFLVMEFEFSWYHSYAVWAGTLITVPIVMRYLTIRWNNLDTQRRKGGYTNQNNF